MIGQSLREMFGLKNRITIYDIAKTLNISGTTVYKALNGKPKVSEELRNLIQETAKKMNYKTNKIAKSLSRKTLKIGIVIEKYYPDFSDDLVKGMIDSLNELMDFKVEGIYNEFSSSYDKSQVLKSIKDMENQGVDGIILCAGACEEYSAIINELYDRGIPLILLISDMPDSRRITSIRQNGRIVGEIGAEFLGLINSGGHNAIFIGNKDDMLHKEIVQGFTERLKVMGLSVIAIYETRDDDVVGYYLADKLLKDYPFIDGIFIGTAHSSGICNKIIEAGYAGKIKIICTDVYPKIIEYMENDIIQATIFQEPGRQGKLAIKVMYEYLTEGKNPENNIIINPRIVLKCNCKNFL